MTVTTRVAIANRGARKGMILFGTGEGTHRYITQGDVTKSSAGRQPESGRDRESMDRVRTGGTVSRRL